MIRIAAFYPEDFDTIRPINAGMLGDMKELKGLIVPEHTRTGFHNDQPVIVAGAVPLWPGVGQGFVLIDEQMPPSREIMEAMQSGLHEVAKNGPFHRIQADVRSEFEKGKKFLRMLGFIYEGPLAAYGSDGSDHERFAFVDRGLI